jgi:hypothetical protein
MATFIFRCPSTGLNVQGWFADAPGEVEGECYEMVACLACRRIHLVNPATGRVLTADEE